MPDVHASAVVDPAATLADDLTVGPFCVVGPQVTLAAGVVLHSHVVIAGETMIGEGTQVYPFASLGHPPQDLKWKGEGSTLRIGAGCTVREGVTINPGTRGGGLVTRVGDRCTLLAGSHVGHDCEVGNDVVLSNNVMLAGHVRIGDGAVLGGGVAVHQFARVGKGAFVGGMSGLEGDLIPYGLAVGNRARLAGLNLVGLRRSGAPAASIRALQAVVERLFAQEDTLEARISGIAAQWGDDPLVAAVVAFVKGRVRRPLCAPDAAVDLQGDVS